MATTHVHKYQMGRSGKVEVCACGRFRHTPEALAEGGIIVNQPAPELKKVTISLGMLDPNDPIVRKMVERGDIEPS